MIEDINKDKVTLSDDLISMIICFIIPSFDIIYIKYFNGENNNSTLLIFNIFEYLKSLKLFNNIIPIKFLFNDIKEYREKKNLYNLYSNICNSCKSFYSEKYKDSCIIFNKKYSKKYNDSKEFREEVSKKIDIKNLLLYLKTKDCYILRNFKGEETYLKKKKSISEIDFLKSTYIEVLTFMELQNTEVKKVSKVHIILAINNYVKNEQNKNNPDIFVEGNDRRFRLIGDLKILFDFIKKQMILRGHLENEQEFPEHISFINLIKYVRYCFPEH